jgi:hypothetical protein
MAEDIVKVACYAFALGNGGQGDVFFERGAEFDAGAPLLGVVDITATDHHHEEDREECVGPAYMKGTIVRDKSEVRAFSQDGNSFQEDESDDAPGGLDDERKNSRGIDEECGTAAVPREHREAQSERSADRPKAPGPGIGCSVEERSEEC